MDDLFSGMMLDAGRCLERPAYYRQMIDFAAERGLTKLLWHFTDDQGCAIEFASVPGIASPHAFTRTEIRELVGYAGERGVQLIPELASLGHTAYLTRLPQFKNLAESDQMFSSICPVAPETRPLIAKLLEETCDVFDTPIVHAGLDETNFGHHALSVAALRTRSRTEIFADHIEFVHDLLTRRGRQMWMWSDGLLHDPVLADRLPRDIVQCNWRYRPAEPVETTQALLDRGYEVVLCSASISSQQTLFPGEQFALPNVRSMHAHESLIPANVRGRVLGRINTVWTPVRYIAQSLWLGLDLVFAIMRDGPGVDIGSRIEAFGDEFYGLDETASWRQACEIVLQRSPMREEWLAAITMNPMNEKISNQIAAAEPEWAMACRLLEQVQPQVRRRHREFEAFLLMVRLASSAYGLSSRLHGMTGDEAAESADQWQRMIRIVEAQWDAERYADDPRKYAAPIEHYAGDHLIPMMLRGLNRLRELSGTDKHATAGVAQPLTAPI
jgi:hypothetical protein